MKKYAYKLDSKRENISYRIKICEPSKLAM